MEKRPDPSGNKAYERRLLKRKDELAEKIATNWLRAHDPNYEFDKPKKRKRRRRKRAAGR